MVINAKRLRTREKISRQKGGDQNHALKGLLVGHHHKEGSQVCDHLLHAFHRVVAYRKHHEVLDYNTLSGKRKLP